MFVVNTTSATVGWARPSRLPPKRVPSSRRRNPGCPRRVVTTYGFLVEGGVVGVVGAGAVLASVPGAAPPLVGAGVVGAGVSGMAGAAPLPAGGVAGAVTGAGANV